MPNLRVASLGVEAAEITTPASLQVAALGVEVAQIAAAPGIIRVAALGIEVASILTAGAPLRVASLGAEVLVESTPAEAQAPTLMAFLAGAGFLVLRTTAFASQVPGDAHAETLWELTTPDDPEFLAPLFTQRYSAGQRLTQLFREGLAAGAYLAQALHAGSVSGDGPRSNVVQVEVLEVPAQVPDAPTLALLAAGPDFGDVSITAMTHPEGVTTAADYGPENDLPFPRLAHLRATPSGGDPLDFFVLDAPETLRALLEDLLPDTAHDVIGRWMEGKHQALGAYSPVLPLTTTGATDDPTEEEEGVTFSVTCTPTSLIIQLEETVPATSRVWWRVGVARPNGSWGSAPQSWIDEGSGRLRREFLLIDPGISFAVAWRRQRGSVWDNSAAVVTPRVVCPQADVAPTPFFVNPPGHPYTEDFTLAWDFRGLSADFALPDLYTYRIRHKPFGAPDDEWEEIAAAHEDTSFLVDFVDELEVGAWHLVGVTTIAPGRESAEAVFLFRRKSASHHHIRNFKADSGMPADAVKRHTGAGAGSDTIVWDHVAGLGIRARNSKFLDFSPGALVFTGIGLTPLGSRGVLTFSERLRSESGGISSRFQSMLFQAHGLALAVSGVGSKSNWAGVLVRRRSAWWHGWGYTGNPRAPGHSGGAAASNAEFNRISFGGSHPFAYGIASGLQSMLHVKRTGTTAMPSTTGGEVGDTVASRWYPSNRVSGEQTYTLLWDFPKVPGGWRLSVAILGPGIEGGWLFRDLLVSELTVSGGQQRLLPLGHIGLSFANPTGGDAIAHSLVVEEITDVPEIVSTCPLPPATENVGYSTELLLDGPLPDGWQWEIVSGELPTGLSLNPATGVISGTPTQSGTWRFCVVITDGVEASGSFCCEIKVTDVGVAGCAREFLVLGSAVGAVSTGLIYLPDALDSFESDLSVEDGTICALGSKTYAPAGTDGEVVWRRIYITGYHRGEVGFWITPTLDGRPLTELRTWLHAPAPQSNRSERFDFVVPLGRVTEDFQGQTQGVRGSALSVQIETTDPVDVWHLETVSFAHEPINTARIRRVGEMEGE